MSIFAIANQKGGCGKTTTAINLCACLADNSYKILLVDMDPQAHATIGVGVDVGSIKNSVYQVLNGSLSNIRDIIQPTAQKNLDIAPSHISLASAEHELVSTIGRETIMRERLLSVSAYYDHIVIDCPPSLGLLTINALVSSHWIIVPLQTHYYALEGMRQLIDIIRLVRERLNPKLTIMGVLLTMYDRRTNISKEIVEGVRDYFKNLVFDTIIGINVKLVEASSAGEPIIRYDPQCTGARDYTELAKEVTKLGREREEIKKRNLLYL